MKVAIVGTGFMAKTHAEAYKQIPHVALAAFTGTNREKGEVVASSFSCAYYEDLTTLLQQDDITVIDICTPTHCHESMVLQAIAAGKHVICEKPLALSLASVDRMLTAAQAKGVVFMAAHVLRFWPEYEAIRQLVDQGKLGQVQMVYASRLAQQPDWNPWYADAALSGGALFDLHLHDVDYMLDLFGPVAQVYATGQQAESGAWNHVISQLSFANGVQACIEGSSQMPSGFPFQMSLRAVGTEGAVDFRLEAGFNLEDLDGTKQTMVHYAKGQSPTAVSIPEGNAYVNELMYFVECVQAGKQPERVSHASSRETIRVLEAILKVLETGEVQSV